MKYRLTFDIEIRLLRMRNSVNISGNALVNSLVFFSGVLNHQSARVSYG